MFPFLSLQIEKNDDARIDLKLTTWRWQMRANSAYNGGVLTPGFGGHRGNGHT